MNMVDFQEKMDPAHRMYLCRMLKMKQLPESLLERYLQVKTMTDRIDGHLSAGVLAMIAVSAGVEELTSQAEKEVVEKSAAPVKAPAMTGAEAEAAIASGAAKPVGSLIEAVDPPVEQQPDLPASTLDRQPVERTSVRVRGQAAEETVDKPAPPERDILWSPGMPVNVLYGDELKPGKIAGVHRPEPGSGKAVQLTVEFEGGKTETFDEDEVEAD